MKRTRFSAIPKVDDPRLTHVMVRSQSGVGYWGRGITVPQAIAAATYMGSQHAVYVCQCDAKTHCDPMTGEMRFNSRGPLYCGKVMRNNTDILITDEFRPARLDP